jgi:uncharacterized membrane protein YphA (DoxX/SURF4 family)
MNIVLWVLQIVLALKFASTATTHGFRRDQAKMQRGEQRFGAMTRPLLTFIALCTLLGGAGLVLPGALKILTWLTPLAAALLALMMLGAIKFHVTCCEKPKIAVDLVLFALAAFVAYGRWVIAPL